MPSASGGKGARGVVVLSHTCKSKGTYQYQTTKNFRNHPEKLVLRKYSPLTRKHEVFREK
jgi:large subunit ribosomal protein L33